MLHLVRKEARPLRQSVEVAPFQGLMDGYLIDKDLIYQYLLYLSLNR